MKPPSKSPPAASTGPLTVMSVPAIKQMSPPVPRPPLFASTLPPAATVTEPSPDSMSTTPPSSSGDAALNVTGAPMVTFPAERMNNVPGDPPLPLIGRKVENVALPTEHVPKLQSSSVVHVSDLLLEHTSTVHVPSLQSSSMPQIRFEFPV